MNEEEAIAFFRKLTIATARSLPMSESVDFLRGALAVAGDHEAVAELRAAYLQLRNIDAQLDLIAGGQLKLPLDDERPNDRQNGDGDNGGQSKA